MNVVLFEPEIAANAGNVARLCAATGAALHLIRPLGFFLHDKHLRRAGLDYWEYVDLKVHDSWDDFITAIDGKGAIYLVETGGDQIYTEPTYGPDDYFVFGSETSGLPEGLLKQWQQNIITIPQKNVRSLNLANTVAIIVYEAWRQLGFGEG